MPLAEKWKLLRAGITPFLIFFFMTGLFVMGYTSLVESSAVGAVAATVAALFRGRLTRQVIHDTTRKTLGVSCMFMWIILAALCFGAVFDGLGVLAQQATDGLRRLRAGRAPVVHPAAVDAQPFLVLDRDRVVEPDALDEAAVPRPAAVRDHEVIEGTLLGARAGEANRDHVR